MDSPSLLNSSSGHTTSPQYGSTSDEPIVSFAFASELGVASSFIPLRLAYHSTVGEPRLDTGAGDETGSRATSKVAIGHSSNCLETTHHEEPNNATLKRRSKYGHLKWDTYKEILKRLYVDENKTLSETMEIMKNEYSFEASTKLYKEKFRQWGWNKNLPAHVAKFMASTARKRRREENKETAFTYGGRQWDQGRAENSLYRTKKLRILEENAASAATTPEGVTYSTPTVLSPTGDWASESNDTHFERQNEEEDQTRDCRLSWDLEKTADAVDTVVDQPRNSKFNSSADPVSDSATSSDADVRVNAAESKMTPSEKKLESLFLFKIKLFENEEEAVMQVKHLRARGELLRLYQDLGMTIAHQDAVKATKDALEIVWQRYQWNAENFKRSGIPEAYLEPTAHLHNSGYDRDAEANFAKISDKAYSLFTFPDPTAVWMNITIGLVYQSSAMWNVAQEWFWRASYCAHHLEASGPPVAMVAILKRALERKHFRYFSINSAGEWVPTMISQYNPYDRIARTMIKRACAKERRIEREMAWSNM